MHITVFGGTGPTGQLLIKDALAAGHQVTAYARSPAKLPERHRITAVEGQLTDADAVAAAIQGSEAVLSVLGGRRATDITTLTDGYHNIVAAMKAHDADRLVALGTTSNTDPADTRELKANLGVKISATFFPAPYHIFVAIGQIVRTSGLRWTLVRVPFLTDGPRTKQINVRMIGDKGGIRVSRANVAAFILQQASDTTYVRQAPYITDK